ncbi:MAG: hypothetical protein A2W00_05370 [Candidatus Eisenbacteria bacterium RBG_16_71_46]|nr:MAG: hypothetical protein A2W00_05370 [Candidatus Eisenbacteria bacterium RBG_16_71_46]
MIGSARRRAPRRRAPRRRASRRRASAWRRWCALLAAVFILLLAPLVSHAQGAGADTVALVWSAPGDDGTIGTAAVYDLRASLAPIRDDADWSAATLVTGLPVPERSGTRQRVTVRGLTRGTTYYFAVRSTDDAGNQSALSNLVTWDWLYDTAPPAAPGGLSATREGTHVRVRWTPNAEPDLEGYTVYRAYDAGGPFTPANGVLLGASEYLDTGLSAPGDAVWYQVTATDDNGNESARSATLAVSLAEQSALWRLDVGYPNPSRLSDPVRIPVLVPLSGAAAAVIDVLDAGGHQVRRLDLAGLAPGVREVVWDGRNDAGRTVAPGVYRAWLIAGGARQAVRLVRVP